MRKVILTAVATLSLIGMAVWFVTSLRIVAWVGHKSLPIVVTVCDGQSGDPVADSTVDVFAGPETPIDGIALGALDIEVSASEGQRFSTNERGQCEFEFPFRASGTDGVWSTSGTIVVSGVWLRVTAPDGRRALVPVDQQSARPRALDDRSPICVTVVLDRPVAP